jgi:hypothetical protein
VKKRTRLVLVYFIALPIIVWLAFYGVGIAYHWLTGRGGPYWAMLLGWGGVVAVAVGLATSWRTVVRILSRNE